MVNEYQIHQKISTIIWIRITTAAANIHWALIMCCVLFLSSQPPYKVDRDPYMHLEIRKLCLRSRAGKSQSGVSHPDSLIPSTCSMIQLCFSYENRKSASLNQEVPKVSNSGMTWIVLFSESIPHSVTEGASTSQLRGLDNHPSPHVKPRRHKQRNRRD